MKILKNISNSNKYYFSLILIMICEMLIIIITPLLLFYQINHIDGKTKSYFLSNFNLWAYIMVIFSFSVFGLVVNIFNLIIKKNYHIIHGAFLIFSSIPTVVLFFPSLWIFYGNKQIKKNNSFLKNDLNLKKIGINGLLVSNILSLLMIAVMFLFPIVFNNDVKFKSNYETSITVICFCILAMFNIVLISCNYFFKNEKFWIVISYINIFTSFLPFIFGSFFSIILLIYYKKDIWKYSNQTY